jgi:glutaminyl-peptide cyclotransferase
MEQSAKKRRMPRAAWAVLAVALCGAAAAAWTLVSNRHANGQPPVKNLKLEDIPFDGAKAYDYLKRLCEIGPRPSGSPGMAAQQKLLSEHFQKLGGQVELQRFRARHPLDGDWVSMANLIVRWHPESKDRVLLCAHYDTLPLPLLDQENPRGRFVGANDNASGVAILMQLGHEMRELKCNYGVDFAFFDGEEFVFNERHPMFLGSEFFARQYVQQQARPRPAFRYRWGVLLDMVGDTDLEIRQDRNSLWWPDTRPLVAEFWGAAARLGVHEFVAKPMAETDFLDDHIILHNIGRISCIDVIDFTYPPWHTQGDLPDRCSALSLAKVGWVTLEWLRTAR